MAGNDRHPLDSQERGIAEVVLRWAWVVILALTCLAPPRWGAAQAREYVVWMHLPSTGVDSLHTCLDTIPGPPIHHLDTLRIKGWCFNSALCDTFNAWVGVAGMEGDSLGVGIDLPPGSTGQIEFRTANNVGQSCAHSWVFAVNY